MTTDLTATDTAAAQAARVEARRMEHDEHRENAQLRADLTEVRSDRNHLTRLLDEFAATVAPTEVIGEHTPYNNPWRNALDLITPMAEVDALRQENQRLRKENDDLTVGCGIPEDPDDDALDDLLRTTDDTVLRQLNDVIDVEPALSAALTHGEVA